MGGNLGWASAFLAARAFAEQTDDDDWIMMMTTAAGIGR